MAPPRKPSTPKPAATLASQPKKLTVDHQKVYQARVNQGVVYKADNLELQEYLSGKGLLTQAELSMSLSNELYLELDVIRNAHGIDSDEYKAHVKILSDHLSKNANYFIKTNVTLKETAVELDQKDIDNALANLLSKK